MSSIQTIDGSTLIRKLPNASFGYTVWGKNLLLKDLSNQKSEVTQRQNDRIALIFSMVIIALAATFASVILAELSLKSAIIFILVPSLSAATIVFVALHCLCSKKISVRLSDLTLKVYIVLKRIEEESQPGIRGAFLTALARDRSATLRSGLDIFNVVIAKEQQAALDPAILSDGEDDDESSDTESVNTPRLRLTGSANSNPDDTDDDNSDDMSLSLTPRQVSLFRGDGPE